MEYSSPEDLGTFEQSVGSDCLVRDRLGRPFRLVPAAKGPGIQLELIDDSEVVFPITLPGNDGERFTFWNPEDLCLGLWGEQSESIGSLGRYGVDSLPHGEDARGRSVQVERLEDEGVLWRLDEPPTEQEMEELSAAYRGCILIVVLLLVLRLLMEIVF